MRRILLRSGKDPFTPVVAESTLTQDVFNSNSGNYLFQHAIWKALATPDTEIVSNGTLSEREFPEPGDAERINEQFDSFVIPLANAFRPEFAKRLVKLTELVKDLTVPVTVIGVGAQAGVAMSTEGLSGMNNTVKAFVGAVLDRSASIGVRGEFTQKYLTELGFPESSVDIIGCPSLFLRGPGLTIRKRVETITADSHLALNLTPEVPGIGAFSTTQAARHPNLTYIGQDANDLRLLLWGVPFPHVDDELTPTHMSHPLYQSDRYRLFLDTWTWYDFLATQDFAYGTRFHGNVAALLAHTPAMLLAHDSRTLELAAYHQMPHRIVAEFTEDIQAAELYDNVDFSAFNTAMPDRFARYLAFLERNGLDHIWQDGKANPSFDAQVAATTFPPVVKTLVSGDGTEVATRLRWLRDGIIFDGQLHKQAYKHPYPHPARRDPATAFHLADQATKNKISAQDVEINDLDARLRRLERRTVVGFIASVRRVTRRKFGGRRRLRIPPGRGK
ncbi:MAG: polysaccharide pyruvyl transferase family protein [Kineosporiaceae bacterium]|nr:polysaccharide pyruvyl transferase family protein [Aeromicrobium sp.]